MVLVADDLEILELVVEDRRRPAPDAQLGIRVGAARQLRAHLLHVVVVDVAIAPGPDEVTHI